MRYETISYSGSGRLILFFTGWGMDAAPFATLSRPGYDIAVVWDYCSFDIDWSFVSQYDEICVVAWSFGVYAASVTLLAIAGKVTRCMAVNGTLYPCDRHRGIPPAIFNGTLAGLSERSVAKFYRRMCGSTTAYAHFCRTVPQRDIASLRLELEAFAPEATLLHQSIDIFDIAIISRDDAIIPAVNQWRAWQGTPSVFIDAYHLVDFQRIIDYFIVDKVRVGQRFTAGFASYDSEADVQALVVERMLSMMERNGVCRRLAMTGCRVLEIGSGTGSLSRQLDVLSADAYLEMWDIAGNACVEGARRRFRRVDAETGIGHVHTESFDIIASASTMQWFNSPTRFLRQCHRVLCKGGYAVLSTFEAGNLAEVAAVTGRSLPLMNFRQWLLAIPDTFELVDCMRLRRTLVFDSAIDVFRHLKATGVNALGRSASGESDLHDILRRYSPGLDGKYHITYRPIIFILRKK